MKYRAEIDGLRALAVLPVILLHAGYETFSGGFVGVDVFFVISGYLITTIILTERELGRFSLLTFYERRARRILPALFLVMLVSIPFAWLWLWPGDFADYSRSLVSVSLFASNIFFWQGSGYWGAVNELKPMLHTWSLSIEEQYYVLFPLFLMLMGRLRKQWLLLVFIAIAVLSLLASNWAAAHSPAANYFLLPTRGWELALGAIVAFIFVYRPSAETYIQQHRGVGEFLSLSGLVLVLYAVFAFDETVPFPGFYALVPTIGTVLIIVFARPVTMVGRMLSLKPVVGIGLISYGAYLWHQPVFAFARHRSLTEPDELVFALLCVFSLLLAWLSWRFVEKPFRNKQKVSRSAIFYFTGIGSVFFIVLGLAGHFSNGFEQRKSASGQTISAIERQLEINHGLNEVCEHTFTTAPECRTSDTPEILLWGDSYAMHLVQGMLASNAQAGIVQMTKTFCGPIAGAAPMHPTYYPESWAKGCLDYTRQVLAWLKENRSVKYVVMSSLLFQYIDADMSLLYRDGRLEPASHKRAEQLLLETVTELKKMGVTPVIVSPPPANGENIGRCLARAEWLGLSPENCSFARSEMLTRRVDSRRVLERVEHEVHTVYLDDLICDQHTCRPTLDSTYLFRDTGHLSKEGSALLGKRYNFYQLITGEATMLPRK